MKKLISIVIPAYNEEGNIQKIYTELTKVMTKKYSWEVIFVDDGSKDNTLKVIKSLESKTDKVYHIVFTRNFGHQYALKAGMDYARGSAIIMMDADLQHPPSMIPKMLDYWESGYKIVSMRRVGSQGSWLKDFTSKMFYSLINALSEVKIEPGSADFRLLDKKVVEIIKKSQESTLFLRGLIAWSGFISTTIDYVPEKRKWGQTNYSATKMFHLAIDAIASFSIIPLRLATLLGFLMSLFTGMYGLYAIVAYFTNWNVITGWPSVIISVLFIGGLQLLILGLIGEYIGKIFLETKKRPLYIVQEKSL